MHHQVHVDAHRCIPCMQYNSIRQVRAGHSENQKRLPTFTLKICCPIALQFNAMTKITKPAPNTPCAQHSGSLPLHLQYSGYLCICPLLTSAAASPVRKINRAYSSQKVSEGLASTEWSLRCPTHALTGGMCENNWTPRHKKRRLHGELVSRRGICCKNITKIMWVQMGKYSEQMGP